jgi:hypothetical protein
LSTAYIDGYALYSTLEPSHFFDVTRPEAADHMAALDTGRAVAAIRQMRLGFKRPEKAAETLLLEMEADGLIETVDLVREHVDSLRLFLARKSSSATCGPSDIAETATRRASRLGAAFASCSKFA